MINYYLQSSDGDALLAFITSLKAEYIGIKQGREAEAAYTDDDGFEHEAVEAIGDTSIHYAIIKAPEETTIPDGIEEADMEVCTKLLGKWVGE